MADKQREDIGVREAGRRGGEATAARHGREHYERIGRMGGSKGGRTTAARYGSAFYEEIGRKGGGRVRELVAKAKAAEAAEK